MSTVPGPTKQGNLRLSLLASTEVRYIQTPCVLCKDCCCTLYAVPCTLYARKLRPAKEGATRKASTIRCTDYGVRCIIITLYMLHLCKNELCLAMLTDQVDAILTPFQSLSSDHMTHSLKKVWKKKKGKWLIACKSSRNCPRKKNSTKYGLEGVEVYTVEGRGRCTAYNRDALFYPTFT